MAGFVFLLFCVSLDTYGLVGVLNGCLLELNCMYESMLGVE